MPVGNWATYKSTAGRKTATKCPCWVDTPLNGQWGGKVMEMMLDSGSAMSLVIKQEVANVQQQLTNCSIPRVKLITASGEPLPITGCVQALVRIHHLELVHQF